MFIKKRNIIINGPKFVQPPTISRGETKINLLQLGNRGQFFELGNKNFQNVMIPSENGSVMLQAKPGTQARTGQQTGHKIIQAVKGTGTGQVMKCVTTSAPTMVTQPKIILTNGINNNPTVLRKTGLGEFTGNRSETATGGTVIHSRPTVAAQTVAVGPNGQLIYNRDVSQLVNKNGQRAVINGLPVQTTTLNQPIVYYQAPVSGGFSQLSRDGTNSITTTQQGISHATGSIQKSPNGYQFLQLVPNGVLTQHGQMMSQQVQSATPPTIITSTNPQAVNSTDPGQISLSQKSERAPAILKRPRPSTSTGSTTENRKATVTSAGPVSTPSSPATAGTSGSGIISQPPSAKIAKMDTGPGSEPVTPLHIKVAAGGTGSTQIASGVLTTDQPVLSLAPSVVKRVTSSITSSPKHSAISDSELTSSNSPAITPRLPEKPSSPRHQSVIRSPRKQPRKQTLIRTELKTLSRLSPASDTGHNSGLRVKTGKSPTEEVSTDEADEFEDENPLSENRTDRLKLIHDSTVKPLGTREINLSTAPKPVSTGIRPRNSRKRLSSNPSPKSGSTDSVSSSRSPDQPTSGFKISETGSCRIRIFDLPEKLLKKERDGLRHFNKPADVKIIDKSDCPTPNMRNVARNSSLRLDAVSVNIRSLQKEESLIHANLEALRSKAWDYFKSIREIR